MSVQTGIDTHREARPGSGRPSHRHSSAVHLSSALWLAQKLLYPPLGNLQSMFKKMILPLAALACLLSVAPATAQGITIRGKDFYNDGKPWLPKGSRSTRLRGLLSFRRRRNG
jgi:hypothetical protein